MYIWEVAFFPSWGSCHLGNCHLRKCTFGKFDWDCSLPVFIFLRHKKLYRIKNQLFREMSQCSVYSTLHNTLFHFYWTTLNHNLSLTVVLLVWSFKSCAVSSQECFLYEYWYILANYINEAVSSFSSFSQALTLFYLVMNVLRGVLCNVSYYTVNGN